MNYLREWLSRPSWISMVGMIGGVLLVMAGMIWRKPRDRILGVIVIVLSAFSGLLLFYFGSK